LSIETVLHHIAEGVSVPTGERFFLQMVSHLAAALEADCAFVGRLVHGTDTEVETVAVCEQSAQAENTRYRLQGTPCEHVIRRGPCVYASGVQSEFPDDLLLADMNANAYGGAPLIDSVGRILGILVVTSSRPFESPPLVLDVLRIIAVRAATELERRIADEQMYRRLLDNAIG
jgi:GAF domain-containing protein